MLGPIFYLELVRAARRGGHHRFRLGYSLVLLVESAVALVLFLSRANPLFASKALSIEEAGEMLLWTLQALVIQQFILLLLAAPAFAAGALTDEKATGTLQFLVTTSLTAREIIIGKWLALMVQLIVLSLPGVPLLVLLGTIAGLSWLELLSLVVGPLAFLGIVVAAALLASVWARKTTSAILWLYAVLAGVFGVVWLVGTWHHVGPLAILVAVAQPGGVWRGLAVNWLLWGGPIAPCLLLAAWRLRPAYRKQLPGDISRGQSSWRTRLPVRNHPIRWRERYLADLSTLPWLAKVPRSVGLVLVVVLTTTAFGAVVLLDPGNVLTQGGGAGPIFAVQNTAAVVASLALALGVALLAGILVAIRCASTVTSERERQTWDLLLLTPLETKTLLRGKLWGVLDAVQPYLLAYLAAAAPLSLLIGVPAFVGVVFIWLATWLLMYFTGATGIECSVASVSSWRGLLRALLSSARTVLERFIAFGLPFGLLGGAVGSSLTFLFGYDAFIVLGFTVPSLGVTALLLLSHAEYQFDQAEQRIVGQERIAPRRRMGGGKVRLRRARVEPVE